MTALHKLFLFEEQTMRNIMLNRQGKKWRNTVKSYGTYEGVLTESELKEAKAFWSPLLIEANLYNGELDFHQLNNGPVFGSDTKEIMDEVFGAR